MSTKSKKTTTYNDTRTAAPPSWTMPGISEVAQRVTDALGSLPGQQYTGDFTAQPDADMVKNISDAYTFAGAQGQTNASFLESLASQLGASGGPNFSMDYLPGFRASPLVTAPDLSQYIPTLPTAAKAIVPQLFDTPDFKSMMPSLTNLPGLTQAQILDAPDLSSVRPTLSDRPDFIRYDPAKWQQGDEAGRLRTAIDAAIAPVMRQLTEQVLPGIKSSAIDAGAYSGDRAMKILPQQALAEAATRGSEVGAGLAYSGFQAEQDRSLQAWQAYEQLASQAKNAENTFNADIYSRVNDALLQQFGIEAGVASSAMQARQQALTANASMANDFNMQGWQGQNSNLINLFDILSGRELSGYQTKQGAAIDSAQMLNDYATDNRGLDINALMSQMGYLTQGATDIYGIQQNATTARDKMSIDHALGVYNADTERGLGAYNANLDGMDAIRNLLMDSMLMRTSQGDLLTQAMNTQTGADQAGINNALARDQYNLEYPFRGLDIATQLLTQLSGNWGTVDSSGRKVETTSTGGLGSVVQGLAGLAGMAGSLGLFGPLGAAASAATKFSPIASTIFGGGAQAGMNG